MLEAKKRKSTGQITLSDVAKLAGVGTMTVSRALRTPEQVSNKLRQKIESAVSTLNYRPNMTASLLASAISNNVIAIVISKNHNNILKNLIDSIHAILVKAGYTLLIIESNYYHGYEQQCLDSIYNHNLSAIVLLYLEKNNIFDDIVNNKNIPIIKIGAQQEDINIDVNDMLAMYLLTEHVIKKGYKNIGLLCANHEHNLSKQRLNGWHKAMLDNHLPNHRVINAAKPANFTTGSELLPDFILNWSELDALICTTDELACGALYECQRRHIKVPYQLAITGFGDSEFSRVSFPPLTTVSLPYEKIGEYAALTLLQQLNCDKTYSLPDLSSLKPIVKSRASL